MKPLMLSLLVVMMVMPVHAVETPSATELLDRMDTLYQQDSAHAIMTMTVVTPDYQRAMQLESWSLGLDYALVKVLEPVRERGVATLQRDTEMWNFLPKINKVVKVPPSMMMGSWMGSDFTNDDLMRDTSWSEEYDVSLRETADTYELQLTPFENTVTVWGAMTLLIDKASLLPLEQRYFDEDGEQMRVMTFSNVTDFGGTALPATMTLTPLNKAGQYTEVEYQQLEFNVGLDDGFFTLQNLRRRR
ncbi:outer membrane lipoprotein-sorting protein [Saccharospirillum sp. MSK14-1]|uniref:outer membrane lipoprotein-sorting protein n=1 Tax=Saccharospirillum sp. MSK14-1 TaxID=1897632 RepID=UPI000D341965|nr:outer membrane lipoprotein-sorting protein [Saccharospirillum sp. MSK14-1]PTY36989.1 outer membrane lipoprotein-sorting protein [Saccharospirillum sp. MSK14-1]